jgi:hypothetical protein
MDFAHHDKRCEPALGIFYTQALGERYKVGSQCGRALVVSGSDEMRHPVYVAGKFGVQIARQLSVSVGFKSESPCGTKVSHLMFDTCHSPQNLRKYIVVVCTARQH